MTEWLHIWDVELRQLYCGVWGGESYQAALIKQAALEAAGGAEVELERTDSELAKIKAGAEPPKVQRITE